MNQTELDNERLYRLAERIGIACGDKKPTMQEEMLARLTVAKEMAQIEKLAELDEVVKDWAK